MKKITLLIISLVCASMLNGQSIERSTLASAGDYFTKPGIQLSWTLGQPSLVETFSKPSVILTQGFQQVDIITGIPQLPSGSFELILYPNPAPGAFNFLLASEYEGTICFDLFDMSGKLLMKEGPFSTTDGAWQHQQQAQGLSTGIYHCRLIFTGNNGSMIQRNLKVTIL